MLHSIFRFVSLLSAELMPRNLEKVMTLHEGPVQMLIRCGRSALEPQHHSVAGHPEAQRDVFDYLSYWPTDDTLASRSLVFLLHAFVCTPLSASLYTVRRYGLVPPARRASFFFFHVFVLSLRGNALFRRRVKFSVLRSILLVALVPRCGTI